MNIRRIFYKILMKIYNGEKYNDLLRKQGVKIGNGCSIHKSVSFETEGYMVSIGNNVRITQGVNIIPHDGGLWTLRHMGILPDSDYLAPIIIGDNCHIGNNVYIMPGVTIGNNCVIACCAVVTKNIPDNSVAAGVPARVIESIQEYYEKKKNLVQKTKNMDKEQKRYFWTKKYNI